MGPQKQRTPARQSGPQQEHLEHTVRSDISKRAPGRPPRGTADLCWMSLHLWCGLEPPSSEAHTPGTARAVSAQGSGLRHLLWPHEGLQVGRLRFPPGSLKGCPPALRWQLQGQQPHLGDDAMRPFSAEAFQEPWNLLPDALTATTSPTRTGPALEDWEAVGECARGRGHGQEKGQRGRCGASRPLLDPSLPWPRQEAEGGTWGRSPEQRSAIQLNSFRGGSVCPTQACVNSRRSGWGQLCQGRVDNLLAQGTWVVNDLAIAHPALWASLASTQTPKFAETATTLG